MNSLLGKLQILGVLQPVDVALGNLLASKSPHGSEVLAFVGSTVSAALTRGHNCLPLVELASFITGLLPDGITAPSMPSPAELRAVLMVSPLVARDGNGATALVLDKAERIYLRRYFRYEREVAAALRARLTPVNEATLNIVSLHTNLARHFRLDGTTPDWQAVAVLLALRARLTIITGGPGTGKTSVILRLLAILIEQCIATRLPPPRIALAAPTGKAVVRLSAALRERTTTLSLDAVVDAALPKTATTLHRLLGIQPGRTSARHDREHPLPYDIVVVDEASMLDLALAAKLCAALAPETRLVLLGDRAQLASVEAGSVFGALCSAAGAPNRYSPTLAKWLESILECKVEIAAPLPAFADVVVELRDSHRFGADSAIGRFAQTICSGDPTTAQALLQHTSADLHWSNPQETGIAAAIAQHIVPRYAPLLSATSPELALKLTEQFRVLCALREGPFGASTLNAAIEQGLRRHANYVDADGWFAGRLVLIVANDYRHNLYNGDIGVALKTGPHGAIEVWFRAEDGGERALPSTLLPAHENAWALTIHKAQGSEFDEVLVVLPQQDARVLSRELLYTAVTRARNKVDLWITPEILALTLARTTQRWSGLADALTD